MAKITKFYFDSATYLVGDDQGNEVKLVVDYKSNRFDFVGEGLEMLKKEASGIAKDLLKRKHGVNFANKFKVY